jgi:hypothetical protein
MRASSKGGGGNVVAIAAEGLSSDQLKHFADHGWVLVEDAVNADRRSAYMEAIDRSLSYWNWPVTLSTQVGKLHNTQLLGDIYLEWLKLPGILESNRQLLGVRRPRVAFMTAQASSPHSERRERRSELLDPDRWDWHRAFGHPHNGLFQRNGDRRVRAAYVGNISFLTGATAGDGVTAVLDGSHRLAGDYASLKGQCSVVQPDAPAGSVFMFSETLLHTATPIVSEKTRYVLINHFVVPWMAADPHLQIPPGWEDNLRDQELRGLFSPRFEGDQGEASLD